MSEPSPPEDPPDRPPRPLWQRLVLAALIVVGLPVTIGLGIWAYYSWDDKQHLEEAIAEADRLDPGWRFDELQTKREAIPDGQNSALVVLRTAKLLPSTWPPLRPTPTGETFLDVEIADLNLGPEERLPDALAEELRQELGRVEPALKEARRLESLQKGRYPVTYNKYLFAVGAEFQKCRSVVNLLKFDAMSRANDLDIDGALSSHRAAVVASRSFGSEQNLIALLIGVACEEVTLDAIERSLAQGEASAAELLALQKTLAEESNRPTLLDAFRGERAWVYNLIQLADAGEDLEKLGNPFGKREEKFDRRKFRLELIDSFRTKTQAVEIAKLPVGEQITRFSDLDKAGPADANYWSGGEIKVALAYLRQQARLQCVIVGLAAERYRLDHDQWPAKLEQLVPKHLDKVPSDPFDSLPLRFRRLNDGVLIYTVGPDRTDNGGHFDRKRSLMDPGLDFCFRLWDPEWRWQPPAPRPPPPGEPLP